MINTKVTIQGTQINDIKSFSVERNIGDFNANSNFVLNIDNYSGRHASDFSVNDEVQIFADIDTNPATTKIFTGVVEKISFSGFESTEQLKIIGRDFGAILQDMTVQPVVYTNEDAGAIAKKIIEQNAVGIVTTNNVDTSSGTTLSKISFNHKNLFDALKQLAELANFIFFVDENKDVHFEAKESISSGLTFDNTNVLQGDFKSDDREVFNKIWVYGDRQLTGATDLGGIGAGSIFTLTDKPHNTRVFVNSVLQEPGGIIGINNPATESVQYLVNFQDKQIVFTSGTTAGDNIPTSGTSNVSIDYERSTPILKFLQDADSITNFGPKTKVIIDKTIKNFDEANDRAVTFLAENKDVKIQGNLRLKGVLAITPGNTAVVDLPNFDINNQTYGVLSVRYDFNKKNNLNEDVLSISLNKKLSDFTDVMKDQMNRMKDVEAGPLEGTLTRLETVIDDVPIDSGFQVWGFGIGSNFVLHNPIQGQLHSSDSLIGRIDSGSTLIQSGGVLF